MHFQTDPSRGAGIASAGKDYVEEDYANPGHLLFLSSRVRGLVPGTSFIGVEVASECSVVDTASNAS